MRGAIVLPAGLALAAPATVRTPMWIAPSLSRAHGHDATVLVHL